MTPSHVAISIHVGLYLLSAASLYTSRTKIFYNFDKFCDYCNSDIAREKSLCAASNVTVNIHPFTTASQEKGEVDRALNKKMNQKQN